MRKRRLLEGRGPSRLKKLGSAVAVATLSVALALSSAPFALARGYDAGPPARQAADQPAGGVTVTDGGIDIQGTFVSKDAFLAALESAKRVEAGGVTATASLELSEEAPTVLASVGDVAVGPTFAVEVANVIRTGILGFFAAAMEKVTYLTAAPFARGTAWLLAIGGATYLFEFTSADELLLKAGAQAYSIGPCWLSIAFAKHAGDHAKDPIADEPDADAPAKAPDSAGKMQQEVKKGQAPADVESVHDPHVKDKPYSKPHVHFKDGTSMNYDGTPHDEGKGTPHPSNKAKKWLKGHGWAPEPVGGQVSYDGFETQDGGYPHVVLRVVPTPEDVLAERARFDAAA